MRRTFLKAMATCVLGVSALGVASASSDPIRVGSVLSVTGPAAYLGAPELNTLQMYVDELNKQGGVLGRKLELIHYDDASDASKANSFARRLIESDKVDFIVGGTTTGSTMAMVPTIERAGVPFMSLAGAVVVTEPVKKWVFKASTTDRQAAERVFMDMQQRGITKVALFSETSGFGQSGKKQSEEVAAKYGIEFVVQETYGPKDTDMSPQLMNIKNNPDVQAVFIFGFGQGPAIATRNYHQLGLTLPLYHAHGVGSDEFIRLAGPAAEGVYALAPALLIADTLAADDPQKEVVHNYIQMYKARFNEDVSMFGGMAHDNFLIAIDAIKRAGTTDKDKVRDAIESTTNFVGTGGVLNMTPQDHMGLAVESLRLLKVENGKWVESN